MGQRADGDHRPLGSDGGHTFGEVAGIERDSGNADNHRTAAGDVVSTGEGMDSYFTGRLVLASGCRPIHMDGTDIETAAVLYFPEGQATWEDGIVTWHGRLYHEGDVIQVGGGEMSNTPESEVYTATGCPEHKWGWLVAPQ